MLNTMLMIYKCCILGVLAVRDDELDVGVGSLKGFCGQDTCGKARESHTDTEKTAPDIRNPCGDDRCSQSAVDMSIKL